MIGVVGAQIGEFLPVVAGHLVQQRAFAVHHFVMGKRQHEVLAEGIHHAEGQIVVMVFPVDRLTREIFQRVVHEAHVPLEAEAEPALVGRLRDLWPRRRFLGDGHDAGMGAIELGVHLLQEVDRLQVFAPALLVGYPLALLARVIEVEHRGHRIDPQPVDVIFFRPEQARC